MTLSKEMSVAIATSQPELSKEEQLKLRDALMGLPVKGMDTLSQLIAGTILNASDLETAEQELMYVQSSIRAAANVIDRLLN